VEWLQLLQLFVFASDLDLDLALDSVGFCFAFAVSNAYLAVLPGGFARLRAA
jgi:hypothetical protein